MRRMNETNVVEGIQAPEEYRHCTFQDFTTHNGRVLLDLLPLETILFDLIE